LPIVIPLKAYQILNEIVIGGQMQESSKRSVMSAVKKANEFEAEDALAEASGGTAGGAHGQRGISPARSSRPRG
jgi:hypothetical protein